MEKITIFALGVSKGSPGPAAIGAQIIDAKGKLIQEVSESIGNATDEFAEYFAVVRALQVAQEYFGEKADGVSFTINLSNDSVKKQLNHESQIKDISLIGHFIEIHNLRVSSFPNIAFAMVKGEMKKEVVGLARKALDA